MDLGRNGSLKNGSEEPHKGGFSKRRRWGGRCPGIAKIKKIGLGGPGEEKNLALHAGG